MSDDVRHNCGIALVRLFKPLEYYQKKYGTWLYGLQKLYLLLEKQRNRGQDGAGIVSLKLDMPPGSKYFNRRRALESSALDEIFSKIYNNFRKIGKYHPELLEDVRWAKENLPFVAELYLGHLRNGVSGNYKMDDVHPVMRQNNWKSRNLVIAGNFSLTNVDELFDLLLELGQHPKDYSDTVTMLEKIGHFLDRENQTLFDKFKLLGYANIDISRLIARDMDLTKVLANASKTWDGGFIVAGMTGTGDSFVFRDPWGIRPAFHYHDEEIAVFASERPAIQTAFNLNISDIREVPPGHAVIIKKKGDYSVNKVLEPGPRKSCSFERIYFSRGSDQEIYYERKKLGELLVPGILKAVDYDLENTVFSYIPNTAESAFYGMIRSVENYMIDRKKEIIASKSHELSEDQLQRLIDERPRVEKVAVKDVKLRTFITQDSSRNDLIGHVYDITYGSVRSGVDNLVIIDDSIVRGATLKESILSILDRLGPKKIVVVSSSPQIRYPDFYGIDMCKIGDLIAFKAAMELLKDTGRESLISEVYHKSLAQKNLPKEEQLNHVKDIYKPFTTEEISDQIVRIIKSPGIRAEIQIVFQTIEDLHVACPNDTGDWYFTGDYPTPGGNKLITASFINYIEGINKKCRA